VVFQISADLKNIQGQLRTMENSFQSSFSKIQNIAKTAGGQLAGALGIGVSVGAVVGFGKEVLALADNLQNLSDQTGLSVQLLSGFKSPLEEAGTSMDAFAKGVFNLQKNLGNVDADSDKVAQSIKRLGLNLNDLRNSSPDEFIKKVTDALGNIENPVERNTILFNLLGKSAKELGPALSQLAGRFDELRAKGLSAEDVKTLDDVGDALTRLKNQALILGAEGVAGILRFFGAIRDVPKIGADLDKATAKAAQAFGLSKERVEGMTSKEVIAQAEKSGQSGLFGQVDKQLAREARDELLNLREEFGKLNAVNVTKPQAAFKGISDGAKKAKSDVQNMVDSFLDGMEKQLSGLNNKSIENLFGPGAALGAQLDAQLSALKDNLRDKQLPIPKGLDEFFGVLKQKILGADEALRQLNDSLEETAKRQQALADEANEGVGIIATSTTAQQAAQLKTAKDSISDLRQQLQIDSIDTSTPAGVESKRVAQIQADFAKTAQKIEELALQAQLSNEESAELTALAWKKALGEIQNKTDEVTEFQRRAMERAFDAGSDLLKDVLGGQIKTWKDFGSRVKKVIDEIAADWLTLQAKKLILGPDFGKSGSGGQVGGLLGKVADLFKGGTPSLPTGYGTRPQGVEGPSLPNGGFFSNPVGSIAGGFGSLLKVFGFHEGGVAGTSASFSRAVPAAYFYSAPRYHTGIDFAGGEMPAILKRGEEVGWPDKLAEKYGKGGGQTVININNGKFTDTRSQAQILARLGAAVKNASRNL
jgi:hypothetical protein